MGEQNGSIDVPGVVEDAVQQRRTPSELLEDAFQSIRQDLAEELLARLKVCSPGFFERLVVELLVKMGYGGSRKDAGEAVGHTGDEGIDGIIKEDRLGLDTIYIQAKRWERTVGRPDIHQFAGALTGQHARKGIFITTSSFSREARDFVTGVDTKIVLIDGKQLANLMIDHDVGVATTTTYKSAGSPSSLRWYRGVSGPGVVHEPAAPQRPSAGCPSLARSSTQHGDEGGGR
jgi:restriction system protein